MNSNEDLDEVPWEEVYLRLTEEAPYLPGDEGEELVGACDIPWADPKLILKGQQFTKENITGIVFAHSGALLLGFSFKNLSTVLLRTGGFNGVDKSLDRIIDTGDHLIPWYEADLVGPNGLGVKEIQVVRKMHSLALKRCLELNKISEGKDYEPDKDEQLQKVLSKSTEERLKYLQALKADLECVDTSQCPEHLLTYNPEVLMSQFDMAMTQYGFFAPVYMAPRTFGIKDKEGLEAFVHLWAVIGRLLGVRDRYNLALYPNKQLLLKIHDQIGIGALKRSDLTTIGLQFSYATALDKLAKGSTLPALTYFGFSSKVSIPQFKGDNLYKLLTFDDKIFVLVVRFHKTDQRNRAKVLAIRKKRRNARINQGQAAQPELDAAAAAVVNNRQASSSTKVYNRRA